MTDKPVIIVALDSFKGCLASQEACSAATLGAEAAGCVARCFAVSDGGEGWLDAWHSAAGGRMEYCMATDPLGRKIKARYLLLDDGTAVLESALTCGLGLLAHDELAPLSATSYGLGLQVAHCAKHGARHIIVGLGGTCTSDAGSGMLAALEREAGAAFPLRDGQPLAKVRFTVATDVANPLLGPSGAARVFAPQKGATESDAEQLELHAAAMAQRYAALCGRDRSTDAGAGAAGGLGYAFMQLLGAECRSGAKLLLDRAGFDDALRGASLVITGEGSADRQTLMGKLPAHVMRRAKDAGVPTVIIAGKVEDREALLEAGFQDARTINRTDTKNPMDPHTARQNIAATVQANLTRWLANNKNY